MILVKKILRFLPYMGMAAMSAMAMCSGSFEQLLVPKGMNVNEYKYWLHVYEIWLHVNVYEIWLHIHVYEMWLQSAEWF